MKYFLAIDIGASSGRHILGYIDNKKLYTEEIYRFKNASKLIDGHLCWDIDVLFMEILNGLKMAKKLGKIPSYIGIDTWAVDYALLDDLDNLIEKIYCYRDSRTNKIIDEVHKNIPFANLYRKTGIQFQPFNTIYQLYEDKVRGRLKNAKTFLMLPDYLNFLLTGKKLQEYTNATSTGMVNAINHKWDEEILKKLDLPKDLFKNLSLPGSVVGPFKKEIEDVLGFNAIVVLPATHDTASAVLAAPILEASPYISSGTWSLLGIEQNAAHLDEKSMDANYSNEGSINYNFRYQKNIMGSWMIQSIKKEENDKYSFPELADLAKKSTIKKLVDVNDNCFLSPKSMGEALEKVIGEKLELKDKMRIIYDSLVHSYVEAIKQLEENTNQKFDTIHIIGGGGQDTYLNELTAKATGKKIIVGPIEATAIGNLIMQMIGTKEIKDLETAKIIIKNSFDIKEIKRC